MISFIYVWYPGFPTLELPIRMQNDVPFLPNKNKLYFLRRYPLYPMQTYDTKLKYTWLKIRYKQNTNVIINMFYVIGKLKGQVFMVRIFLFLIFKKYWNRWFKRSPIQITPRPDTWIIFISESFSTRLDVTQSVGDLDMKRLWLLTSTFSGKYWLVNDGIDDHNRKHILCSCSKSIDNNINII